MPSTAKPVTSHDKVVEFLLENDQSRVPQIARGIKMSQSTVRRVLDRGGVFACAGLWADARGDHGIARWYVRKALLTDTPNDGWLSLEGKIHPCAPTGHRNLAEVLAPKGSLHGEHVIERLQWIKLQDRKFLSLLIEGVPTQAQINRMYDYYKATDQTDEIKTLMALVKRRSR
jgi:hypothetical protein